MKYSIQFVGILLISSVSLSFGQSEKERIAIEQGSEKA